MSQEGSGRGRNFLVAGVAGFIGFHVARRLLEAGESVVGIDYSKGPVLEDFQARRVGFLCEHPELQWITNNERIRHALHLDVQEVVSVQTDPETFVETKSAFLATHLEFCAEYNVQHCSSNLV